MKRRYTLGSLFDGSGGFPLSGTLCGIEPVWAAEIEPYPIAVTRSRFPNMKHLGDISKVRGDEIEPVDIITFGSPCQDLSVAGKRAGLKHEDNGDDETTRSGLFMEAVRIIREMRAATNGVYPTFAIWENVPGAFSSNRGEDFRIVLEELVRICEPRAVMPSVPKAGWAYADTYAGDGWSLAYRVLDAQHIRTAQRRRRVYLVLHLGGGRAREILFERNSLRGHLAKGGAPWQVVAADPQDCSGADDCKGSGAVPYTLKIRSGVSVDSSGKAAGKGALIQVDKAATLAATQDQYLFQPKDAIPIHDQATRHSGKRGDKSDGKGNGLGVGSPGDPMNTLTSADRHAVGYVAHRLVPHNSSTRDVFSKAARPRNAGDPQVWVGSGVANTLNVFDMSPSRVSELVVESNKAGGVELVSEIFQTYQAKTGPLMANSHPGSYAGQDAYNDMLVAGKENDVHYIVRRLTPTECARLQGFPDWWGHIDEKTEFSDEEYLFWLNVRNTHAAINGKQTKDHSVEQMLKWYSKLHTDSAEYKMWGNGIALPCALYVMQGIQDAIEREEKQ